MSDSSLPPDPLRPKARRSGRITKQRVLVVDDDVTVRALARHALEADAFEVEEAEGGREALAKLRRGPLPEFLITDLKMAAGSGGWLVSQVGYEFPELVSRTVVITGAASSAAAAHVAARWRCPIVAKPFSGPELTAAIAKLRGR